MGKDVFISYAVEDGAYADQVHRTLDAAGLSCWQAPGDIPPGTSYPEAIIEAINTCRMLLLIFSSHANSSPHVQREVERAVSKVCPVLAVRIGDFSSSPAMEYLLSTSQWLDASALPMEQCLDRIRALVMALLSGASGGAAPAGARLSRLEIHLGQHSVCDLAVDAASISLGGFESYARNHRLDWSQRRLRLGETTLNCIRVQNAQRVYPMIYVYPDRVQNEPSEDTFRNTICDFLYAAQREGATSFAVAPTGKTFGFSRQRALRAMLDGYADYLIQPRGGLLPTIGKLHFEVKETRDMNYECMQLLNEVKRYFTQGLFAETYRLSGQMLDKNQLPIDIVLMQ